ncbi:HD-GYP domain-containing protein [Calidifontibacillus erzurumensis]|uniref:HD-GYP domain-containing protein n=1 Tax=Calidifontibacillus erzurumensis TaxID=2741433 RepID=UPI0035B54B1B
MKVHPNQLKEGCILEKDVFSLTNFPIVPRKTVLSAETLEIIKAFLIKEVHVEPILATGEPFKPDQVLEADIAIAKDEEIQEFNPSFIELYLKAVYSYKKFFQRWQSGISIDMPALRTVIVPVIEEALKMPRVLFTLHHYSNADNFLYHHSINIAALSAVLAKTLNLPKGDCIQIGLAGALCDAGMAKINPKIITKKGVLTLEEIDELKKHPVYSFMMIKNINLLKDEVKKAVYKHHERIDGSGYPNGISGDYLSIYERIIAVSDVYYSVTSEQHNKNKQSPFKALEFILQDQFGKFDGKVVQALTELMTNFTTGTKVRLSNNKIGEIVFIEQSSPTRPMVRLIESGEIIYLIHNRDLYIEEVL